MQKKAALLSPVIVIAVLYFFTGCAKEIKNNENPPDGSVTIEPVDGINETYLKEGFISSDTFRVVLVECDDYNSIPLESLKDKARKRALATLQKYLASSGRIVDDNANAKILNLIDASGEFSKQDISVDKNSIYYFEIKKRNIRKQVDNLSEKR